MEDSIKGFANSNSSVVGGQFTEGSQGVLCFYGGTDAYIDEKEKEALKHLTQNKETYPSNEVSKIIPLLKKILEHPDIWEKPTHSKSFLNKDMFWKTASY